MFFISKWKRQAKEVEKGGKKFLYYRRDLLSQQQVLELQSRLEDLKNARKAGQKDAAQEACARIEDLRRKYFPREQKNALGENFEMIFVAMVIALGLRTYVVQPFKIPTGSMQPTLNGFIATSIPKDKPFPNILTRQWEKVTRGRSYVDIVLKHPKRLRAVNPVEQETFLHFFTRTVVYFDDGSKVRVPGPKATLMSRQGFGFGKVCGYPTGDMSPEEKVTYLRAKHSMRQPCIEHQGNDTILYLTPELPAGTVIARGYVDSGDLILVDKFSYHFRKPQQGEVFVFNTQGIEAIASEARKTGSSIGHHYIKRLAATPGTSLQIRGKELYVKTKNVPWHRASQKGFVRVMSQKNGYSGYESKGRLAPGETFMALPSSQRGMSSYIALGDNSPHSSDSRYWGTVKEHNLVGPAWFTLWPFTSGHWGLIK